MQSNSARAIPADIHESAYVHIAGTVKGGSKDSVMVETANGLISASVALTCLVTPESGDKVLVSRSNRCCYVLAVLERPSGPDVCLDFPGDIRLSAVQGRIDVSAGEGLNLVSAKKTHMMSSETGIVSGRVNITAKSMSTCTDDLETHARRARLFADAVDVVARSVTQKAKNVVRWVEEIETLSIGSMIHKIRKAMIIHSYHTNISARKDVRIDGERIHMG